MRPPPPPIVPLPGWLVTMLALLTVPQLLLFVFLGTVVNAAAAAGTGALLTIVIRRAIADAERQRAWRAHMAEVCAQLAGQAGQGAAFAAWRRRILGQDP